MIADLITPEIHTLMKRIERLDALVKATPPGSGCTRAMQAYSVTTYWGARKLVATLRAIEAERAEADAGSHDLMCDGQLTLDLAA